MSRHPEITRISTAEEGRQLGQRLVSPDRDRPLCLVSTPHDSTEPHIDIDEIASTLGDRFDYVVIETGPPTRALEASLPPKASAFAGAGRIYPVNLQWEKLSTYPLVFCMTPADGGEATRRLIRDGLRVGTSRETSAPVASGQVTAVVKRIVPPTAAILETGDGQSLLLSTTGLPHNLRIGQLVQPGQEVTGQVSDGRNLTPSLTVEAADVTRLYGQGDVVLARVAEVGRDRLNVDLTPWVRAVVLEADIPLDGDLSERYAPGQTIRGRVLRVGQPGGRPWKLSLIDIDTDGQTVDAPGLLPGGPSWLNPAAVTIPEPTAVETEPERPDNPEVDLEPEPVAKESDAGEAESRSVAERLDRIEDAIARVLAELERIRDASTARPTPPTALAQSPGVILARQERDEAQFELDQALARVSRVEADRDRHREDASNLRRELKKARKGSGVEVGAGPAFLDPEEEFRWRVQAAWVTMVPAAEKSALPLGEYVILPGFLESVEETPGIDISKVVETVVHLATGRIHDLPARQTRQLRESASSDKFVTREDGASCWRVSLQNNSPSARRLHYWQPGGGRPPELSSVRLHDDVRP